MLADNTVLWKAYATFVDAFTKHREHTVTGSIKAVTDHEREKGMI
jgi:hypothetical protein